MIYILYVFEYKKNSDNSKLPFLSHYMKAKITINYHMVNEMFFCEKKWQQYITHSKHQKETLTNFLVIALWCLKFLLLLLNCLVLSVKNPRTNKRETKIEKIHWVKHLSNHKSLNPYCLFVGLYIVLLKCFNGNFIVLKMLCFLISLLSIYYIKKTIPKVGKMKRW